MRILLLDDLRSEAELIEHTLRLAGLDCSWRCVRNSSDFAQALATFNPHVVLVDACLDGPAVVRLTQQRDADVPVIGIGDAFDAASVAALMGAGAVDCVLRARLERLPFAIGVALHGVAEKRNRRKAEAALHDSEIKFRRLFEAAKDGILILDGKTGAITEANPFILDRLGYSHEEVIGKSVWDIGAFKDIAAAKLALETLLGNTYIRYENLPLKAKDGRVLDVEFISNVYQEGDNKVIQCNIRDISERKRMEKALQDSREMLERTESIAHIGGWERDLVRERLTCSREMSRILGHDPETYVPDFADWAATIHVDDRYRVSSAIEDLLLNHAQRFDFQFRIVRPDGTERVLHDVGEISYDATGGPIRMHGSMVDMTERALAERHAADEASKFRVMIDQSLAGIYIIEASGKINYINQRFAEMSGYSQAEVIGRPFLEFIGEPDRQMVASRFAGVVTRITPAQQIATLIRRKDGSYMEGLTQGSVATIEGRPVLIGVTIDITERKHSERAIERLNRTLRTLSAGNSSLVHATSEAALLESMCNAVVHVGGYPIAWIGFAEDDACKTIRPVTVVGDDLGLVAAARISWADDDEHGLGPTGIAIRTGQPQVTRNFDTDERMAPWREQAKTLNLRSSIALPLTNNKGTFGAAVIYAHEQDAFGTDEVNLLMEMVNDLAYGIDALRGRAEHEIALVRLDKSLKSAVAALAGTVEVRDPYTAGHQRNVARLASAIGREMGLSRDRIQGIYLAAVIHDIGKIQVPAEILSKPGKLSELEYKLVQVHAQAGYDIVKGIEFPWPIAQMILQHHERLDGSGYPNGIGGDAILLETRILSVADVVDAMMSHRPYRSTLGLDAALHEIEKGKGRLYDPDVVVACIALFRQKGFAFDAPGQPDRNA